MTKNNQNKKISELNESKLNGIEAYQKSRIDFFYDGIKNLGKGSAFICKICVSSILSLCEHASKVGGSPLK